MRLLSVRTFPRRRRSALSRFPADAGSPLGIAQPAEVVGTPRADLFAPELELRPLCVRSEFAHPADRAGRRQVVFGHAQCEDATGVLAQRAIERVGELRQPVVAAPQRPRPLVHQLAGLATGKAQTRTRKVTGNGGDERNGGGEGVDSGRAQSKPQLLALAPQVPANARAARRSISASCLRDCGRRDTSAAP